MSLPLVRWCDNIAFTGSLAWLDTKPAAYPRGYTAKVSNEKKKDPQIANLDNGHTRGLDDPCSQPIMDWGMAPGSV